MHLSLSVEDTNRLRQKLGLKLIDTDPEKATSVDDSRTADLKSRLAESNRKLKEMTPASLPTEPSHEEPAKLIHYVQSTETWLAKMNQRERPVEADNSNVQLSLHLTDKIENQEIKRRSIELPEPQTVSTDKPGPMFANNSKQTISSLPPEIVAHEDPVNAPSEVKRVQGVTKQQLPRAVFKPKRLKPNAKTRRKAAPLLTQIATRTKGEEDEELRRILSQSLQRHKPNNNSRSDQTRLLADQDPISHIFENTRELGQTELVIDTTKLQLSSTALQYDSDSPAKRSLESQRIEPPPIGEDEAEKLPEHNTDEHSPELASTHLTGVASILRQMALPEKSVNSDPTRASRSWARRLAEKRKEREGELAELEILYKTLPPKERKEAIELHQKRAAQDQMQEAQDFGKHYKPEVQIKYKDDTGRQIDGRHAFKRLSKAFHKSQPRS